LLEDAQGELDTSDVIRVLSRLILNSDVMEATRPPVHADPATPELRPEKAQLREPSARWHTIGSWWPGGSCASAFPCNAMGEDYERRAATMGTHR
jgi:hypothetical protein